MSAAESQRDALAAMHRAEVVADRVRWEANARRADAAEAEVARLRKVLADVRALHVRREGPVVEYDCLEGDCEHAPEDFDGRYLHPDCPVLAAAVCAHCADQTDPGDGWEHMIRTTAYWPCATVRALDGDS